VNTVRPAAAMLRPTTGFAQTSCSRDSRPPVITDEQLGGLSMRYRLLLSMLGLLAITSTPSAQPTAKLDGSWRAVTAERDGKSATDVIGHRLTFAGGKFTITRGRDGKTVYAGTYKTDSAKRPAQIDFDNTNAGPKGNYNTNLRKPTFDIGKMQSGQPVLATFDNQQDFAPVICGDIIKPN
jgi:uncharacterized protein (TIGR03067 family)